MEVFEALEFRSFWNIWFWAAVVLSWSATSHFILGVPYDLIVRANREGGAWSEHCDALAHAQIFRLTRAFEEYGAAITCIVFFGLGAVGSLAFYLDWEAARALFVLLLPLTLVHGFTVPLAFRLKRDNVRGAALRKALGWRRFWHQVAGLFAIILVTAAAVWELVRNTTPIT